MSSGDAVIIDVKGEYVDEQTAPFENTSGQRDLRVPSNGTKQARTPSGRPRLTQDELRYLSGLIDKDLKWLTQHSSPTMRANPNYTKLRERRNRLNRKLMKQCRVTDRSDIERYLSEWSLGWL